jgi:hypothetical protein
VLTQRLPLFIAILTLLLTACAAPGLADGGGERAAVSPELTAAISIPSDCPVTRPPETPFTPPRPWPAEPPRADRYWFGDSGLWTALPIDGTWGALAQGDKFWWWSQEFDVSEDETPDLTLSASRLDGAAPVFQTTEATNGYHERFNWAMLSGVTLGSPGCWEITGHYKGHELSFVLWVPGA